MYAAHAVVEMVLGAVKLRGSYSSVVLPPGAEKFARHHGVALLSLALLGALALGRGLVNTEAGEVVSLVLASFHTGAVLVMVHAMNAKVVFLHAPFAVGFAWHAAYVRRRKPVRVTA